MLEILITVSLAFGLAYWGGTFVEYLMHRFVLHSKMRNWITERHWKHHVSNEADHVWGDFRDSLPVTLAFCWLGFLHSVTAGVAFLLGTMFYTVILAISHRWSHEHPNWLVALGVPVHAIHHTGSPNANFGVTTYIWDRLFGTYLASESGRNSKLT